MNRAIIVALVLASLACMVYGKTITIQVKEGYNSGRKGFGFAPIEVDDESTFIEAAKQAMYKLREFTNEHARFENLAMVKYPDNMKLKTLGIKDNSKLILKYWSRMEDLGANTLARILPVELPE